MACVLHFLDCSNTEAAWRVVGVFSTRARAISNGRALKTDSDDQYSVMEHIDNSVHAGACVWSDDCDRTDSVGDAARESVAKYWTQFPLEKNVRHETGSSPT